VPRCGIEKNLTREIKPGTALADEAWPWWLFSVAAAVMTTIQWNLGKK